MVGAVVEGLDLLPVREICNLWPIVPHPSQENGRINSWPLLGPKFLLISVGGMLNKGISLCGSSFYLSPM